LPGAAVTVMLNASNPVVYVPSLTLIAIFACVAAVVGVPLSWPVALLNAAHAGLLAIVNVSASPFASLAEGVNEYALPACTVVAGEPLITGGVGATPPATLIENAGRATVVMPSLTAMVMLEVTPAERGNPLSLPLLFEKCAQLGLLRILKVSVLPSGSLARGVNEYQLLIAAVVFGLPEIVGGLLVGSGSANALETASEVDSKQKTKQRTT